MLYHIQRPLVIETVRYTVKNGNNVLLMHNACSAEHRENERDSSFVKLLLHATI